MDYLGFGKRLHHEVPGWVEPGSLFHIRIRAAKNNPNPLTEPELASRLLESAHFYESRSRWHLRIFLLMPDHLHAVLAVPRQEGLARVISQWKAYHSRTNRIQWQDNFFDHRLRNADQIDIKIDWPSRHDGKSRFRDSESCSKVRCASAFIPFRRDWARIRVTHRVGTSRSTHRPNDAKAARVASRR